jgi:SAM-dependent methyltransferase
VSRIQDDEPWPPNYVDLNRRAYDGLAEEYRRRRAPDRLRDPEIVNPFLAILHQQFGQGRLRVLDVGCGGGLNLAMFGESGLDVTGIDVSANMLAVAHDSWPSANLIHADFLQHDFGHLRYHGIFAKAFIHLFPHGDALKALAKIHSLVLPDGVFYVTTTVEAHPSSGPRRKSDYAANVVRFRRTWSEPELLQSVRAAGFMPVTTGYNAEPDRHKSWFNIWAVKESQSVQP